jgi:hypothetical protein
MGAAAFVMEKTSALQGGIADSNATMLRVQGQLSPGN